MTDITDIVFNGDNWNLNTTITVQGVADDVVDGDVPYTVDFYPIYTNDSFWSGDVGASVALLNRDSIVNRVGMQVGGGRGVRIISSSREMAWSAPLSFFLDDDIVRQESLSRVGM